MKQPVEKGYAFSDKRFAPRRSAHFLRLRQKKCTFAGREVFSATRVSRQKTDLTLFRRCGGETLRGLSTL